MFACAYDGAYVCAEKLTQGDIGAEMSTHGQICAERLTQGKIRRDVHAGLNKCREAYTWQNKRRQAHTRINRRREADSGWGLWGTLGGPLRSSGGTLRGPWGDLGSPIVRKFAHKMVPGNSIACKFT